MRHGRSLVLCVLLLLLPVGPAPGYVLQTNDVDGQWRHPIWLRQSMPVPFVVNDRSFDLLPGFLDAPSPLPAIEAALRTWSIPPVELYLDGTVATAEFANDGTNLITVARSSAGRDFVGVEASRTNLWWNRLGDQLYITDTDIVLNPSYSFATDGTATAYDLENMVSYSLAWAVGLDGSPIASASAFNTNYPGQIYKRSLGPDDIAGLRALYGGAGADLGAIAGRVLTLEEEPVFGAHVVALNAAGIVQVGALTDWTGSFSLTSLPPGSYRVYVEPLDGPVTPGNLLYTFRDARRDFRTLFAGGNRSPAVILVQAGETSSLEPFRVEARPPALNPRWVEWSPDGVGFPNAVAQAVQVRPGRSNFLALAGEGLAGVPRTGFSVSGGDIQFDSTRIVRGLTDLGNPYVILPLTVRPDALPGARTVIVSDGTEWAAFTGCIEVSAGS
jgi:hypothetical protein